MWDFVLHKTCFKRLISLSIFSFITVKMTHCTFKKKKKSKHLCKQHLNLKVFSDRAHTIRQHVPAPPSCYS